MINIYEHLGIDYGSKMAGTTVVCHAQNGLLVMEQSIRNSDADSFIIQCIKSIKPQHVFIDAPLSLPLAYSQKTQHPDFFYRSCDRALKAMSPMFLGGLTARAIKIKHEMEQEGIVVRETYPAAIAKVALGLQASYKKDIGAFVAQLKALLPLPMADMPTNQHQIDGILAWLGGYRFICGKAEVYGIPEEGQIIV